MRRSPARFCVAIMALNVAAFTPACGDDEHRGASDARDANDVAATANTIDSSDAPDIAPEDASDTALEDASATELASDVALGEQRCDDQADDDNDGLIDCDDIADCGADDACAAGSGAIHAPCFAATDCQGPRPACASEAATGHPSGECRPWCEPESDDCGLTGYCLGELPARGQCVARCSVATGAPCRDGYACSPYQIVEGGEIVDIGICVPACRDDDDCLVRGACFDAAGALSGLCVSPENCSAAGDEDEDGRLDCEDDDCAAESICDPGPLCAAPVESVVVGAEPVTITGDTTGGTTLARATCTGNHGGHERVYGVTAGNAGQTGRLDIELGGGPDFGVYVRKSCTDPATELGCADNAYTDETYFPTLAVPGGVPLALFVDAIGPEDVGAFAMKLTFVADVCGDGAVTGLEGCDDHDDPPADGDGCSATCQPELDVLCAGATALAETPVSANAIDSLSRFFQGSCMLPGNSAPEDIYVFTAPRTGRATVKVAGPGNTTDLAVYVRTSCTERASEVGCADDVRTATTETLTFSVDAGVSYWVFVDGMLSDFDVGPYTLTLQLPSL